ATSERLNHESVLNYSQKIYRAVGRISSIVKGLKLLANQSEKVPKKEVSICDILNETTPFYHEHFNSLGIHLDITPPPAIKVYCHPVQISQVLMNLLKNASDAIMEDEADKNRWIKLDYKTDMNNFYFIITNSGKKIAKEMINKIFTPFLTTK